MTTSLRQPKPLQVESLPNISPDDLETVVQHLKTWLKPGTWLLLSGDLGAGKTTLTQKIAAMLGSRDVVNSPTFAVLNTAQLQPPFSRLIHLDLYRIRKPNEICFLGLEAEVDEHTLVIVEWSENLDDDAWHAFFESTRCRRPTHVVCIEIDSEDRDTRGYQLELHF